MTARIARMLRTALAAALLSGCRSATEPSTLLWVEVSPPRDTVPKGLVVELRATAVSTGMTAMDVTRDVAWSSSDPAVASVVDGRVLAVVQGRAVVTAALGGRTASATIDVTDAAVVSLELFADRASVAKGLTVRLTAEATFTDGTRRDVTGEVEWACPDGRLLPVGVGVFAGVEAGAGHAVARLGGAVAEADVEVRDAEVVGIRFADAAPTVPEGIVEELVVRGDYTDGLSRDVSDDVLLVSTDEAVVRVAAGHAIVGVAVGDAWLGATLVDRSAMVPVRVTPGLIEAMWLLPAEVSMPVGGSAAFDAIARLSDGDTTVVDERVTWSTDDPTVAVASNAAGERGVVRGLATGTVTVTATDPDGGVTATGRATVLAPAMVGLAVSEDRVTIHLGDAHQLFARAVYSDGSSGDVTDVVIWYPVSPGVVAIDRGLVTAIGPGSTLVMVMDAFGTVPPAYALVTVN